MEKILKFKKLLIVSLIVISLIIASIFVYFFTNKDSNNKVIFEQDDFVVLASSKVEKDQSNSQMFLYDKNGKLKLDYEIGQITGATISLDYSIDPKFYSSHSSKYIDFTNQKGNIADFKNGGIAENIVSNENWNVLFYNIGIEADEYITEYLISNNLTNTSYTVTKKNIFGATYGISENKLFILYSKVGELLPLNLEVIDLVKNTVLNTAKLADDIAIYFDSVEKAKIYFTNDKILLAGVDSSKSVLGVFDRNLKFIQKLEFTNASSERFQSIVDIFVKNDNIYIYTFDNQIRIYDKNFVNLKNLQLEKLIPLSLNSPMMDKVFFLDEKLIILKEVSNKIEKYIFNIETGKLEKTVIYELPKVNIKFYRLQGVFII